MKTNIFEKSWKDFSVQFQKQRNAWNQMMDQYFDQLNDMRKAAINSVHKKQDVTHESPEPVIKKMRVPLKRVQTKNTTN